MREARPLGLAEIFQRLDGGGTVEEIKTKLRDLTAAVLDTGNSGKLTIELVLSRDGKASGRQLMIRDQIKVSMPKIPKGTTLLFADYDGHLTAQDPDQLRLPVTESQESK
jgi:hypothetical protein